MINTTRTVHQQHITDNTTNTDF